MKTQSLKPTASSLILDRSEAVSAKRALQSAYDRINRVRNTLFGSRAEELDHAMRDISVSITALRDADRNGNDGDGVRKIERDDPSDLPKAKSLKPKAFSRRAP